MTSAPYEATIEILADGVQVTGLTVRHASPSIANNYAVYVRGSVVQLTACDVSSSTGSAVVRCVCPSQRGGEQTRGQ